MIRFFDSVTGEELADNDVKNRLSKPVEHDGRFSVVSYKDLHSVDGSVFFMFGIEKIDYIETDPPSLVDFQRATKGDLDKSEDGVWRETWTVSDMEVEEARAKKIAWLESAAAQAGAVLKGAYPQWEIDGWHKQEDQAIAAIAGSTDTPLLDALAQARGSDRMALANRIMEKVAEYEVAYGILCGRRQAVEAAILEAETLDDLRAISW